MKEDTSFPISFTVTEPAIAAPFADGFAKEPLAATAIISALLTAEISNIPPPVDMEASLSFFATAVSLSIESLLLLIKAEASFLTKLVLAEPAKPTEVPLPNTRLAAPATLFIQLFSFAAILNFLAASTLAAFIYALAAPSILL